MIKTERRNLIRLERNDLIEALRKGGLDIPDNSSLFFWDEHRGERFRFPLGGQFVIESAVYEDKP